MAGDETTTAQNQGTDGASGQGVTPGASTAVAAKDAGLDKGRNPDGSLTLQFTDPPSDNKKLFDSFVPDEYKGKEWVQNIAKAENPRLEIFKQIEHKDSLIGRQQQIQMPAGDATPEQWKTYFRATGVPETAEGYKYEGYKAEGEDAKIADALNKSRSPEFLKDMAMAAHELGLRPDQYAKMAEKQDALQIKHHKQALADLQVRMAAQNQDLVARSNELFGQRREQVIKNGEKLLELVPQNIRPVLAQLDNNGRIALAAVLDSIHERYVKEDRTPLRNTGNQTHSGSSVDELRAERMSLMQQEGSERMNSDSYKRIQARIVEINNTIREMAK